MEAQRVEWVQCPICGEDGMPATWREGMEPNQRLIACCNMGCESNQVGGYKRPPPEPVISVEVETVAILLHAQWATRSTFGGKIAPTCWREIGPEMRDDWRQTAKQMLKEQAR